MLRQKLVNFFVAFVWKIEDTIISYWNFLNFTALASFEDNSVIENESANALTASIVKNETKVLVQFEVSKKYIFNAKKCLAQVCFTKNVNLWSFMFFDFFDTLFCMIFYWHNLLVLPSADYQANLSWYLLNVPPNCVNWR